MPENAELRQVIDDAIKRVDALIQRKRDRQHGVERSTTDGVDGSGQAREREASSTNPIERK